MMNTMAAASEHSLCTPERQLPLSSVATTVSSNNLGDSFSVTPTPPRLRRSVTSHGHLEATDHHNMTTPDSVSVPPIIFNRRRAVSDSLVRFLGLDGEDRIVPPTERDPWLDTLDQTTTPVNLTPAATPKTADPVKEAWEAAIRQAEELEDIGIESLRLPCSLDTFYRTFLADEAPFSFDRFQREHIHDHNVVVSLWEPYLSGNNDDNNINISQQTRTLSFTHPIKKGVGRTEAHTRRRQVVRRFGTHGILFQNTTHVEGIPAADCFSVHDFWTVAPVVDDNDESANGHPAVTVSVRFAPRFTKRTLFRSVIERNIKRETRQWCASYETMARSALEKSAEQLNAQSERSGLSSILVTTDDTAAPATLIGKEQESFFVLPSSWQMLCIILVLVLLIVVLILVVLILQMLQTREALSVLQQDLAGLHLQNQQLLQQQWVLITAQQQYQGQIVRAATTNTMATSALNFSQCQPLHDSLT